MKIIYFLLALIALVAINAIGYAIYRSVELDEREDELSKYSVHLDERANMLARWEEDIRREYGNERQDKTEEEDEKGE